MNVVSLFSGCLGLDLGLEAAGLVPIAYVENDADCLAVIRARRPGISVFTDIRDIASGRVTFGRPVHVIAGGFPCQDLSYAGKGAGLDGDRSGLWHEMARAVRVLRPEHVIVENVPGLSTRGLGRVLYDLAEAGYVGSWFRLRAADIGAPHGRERIFVVASDSSRDRRVRVASGDSPNGGMAIKPGHDTDGCDLATAGPRDRHPGEAAADSSELGRAAGPGLREAEGERRDARLRRRRSGDDGREAPADADDTGLQGSKPTRRRLLPARGGSEDAADADHGPGLGERPRPEPQQGSEVAADTDGEPGQSRGGRGAQGGADAWAGPAEHDRDGLVGQAEPRQIDWGVYGPAVGRWEQIIGRDAPGPTDDRGRLTPAFVEWMMGFPDGWTDVGLKRKARLRMLGNAVQVQVAEVIGRCIPR